jgi:hypothetical protein
MLKCAMAADFSLPAENQYHSGFQAMYIPLQKIYQFQEIAVIRYRVEL